MTGTAAEVTPLRSVDDVEIGVGPITLEIQARVPRHRARAQRALGALARVRRDAGARPRRDGRAAARAAIPLSQPWLDEREEELVLEVLRSGRLSLGPTIERFEQLVRRARRRALRGRGLERDGRPAPARPDRRARARRRGRSRRPYSFVAVGELLPLRGRDAGLRRRRPAHATTSIRRRSRRRSRRGRRRSSRSTSSATRASSTRSARSASGHGLALIDDACEALGAEYRGRPVGAHGRRRGLRASTRTSRSRPARAAS